MTRPLNLIINGLESRWGAELMERALQSFDLGYCLTFCNAEYVPRLNAEEHQYHTLHEFDHVDWNTVRPLDAALIERMRHCESVVMDIMTRHERNWTVRSYAERKRWYLMHLRYWNHILEEKKIDAFICTHVPHHNRTYVLYSLCREKGIPVLFFHFGFMRDTLIPLTDYHEYPPAIRQRFEALQASVPAGQSVPLADRMERFVAMQIGEKSNTVQWHVSDAPIVSRRQWWAMVWTMLTAQPVRFFREVLTFIRRFFTAEFWRRFPLRRAARMTHAAYDRSIEMPDLQRKFVLFPLHMQPECSTLPMAGPYNNQVLIAQMVAACLPDDVHLYIKEHPIQGRLCRSVQFYKDLRQLPRVHFMPRDIRTDWLTDHALAVVTATGTPGLTAILRGKPVLMFGYNFYQDAPGVFRIRTLADCETAMKKILQGTANPSLHDARLFLKALEETSIEGSINAWDQGIPMEQNIATVAKAIADRLAAQFPAAMQHA